MWHDSREESIWGISMRNWNAYHQPTCNHLSKLGNRQEKGTWQGKKKAHDKNRWVRGSHHLLYNLFAWYERLTIPLLALNSHLGFPEHGLLFYVCISLYMLFTQLALLLSFNLPSFVHLLPGTRYPRILDWPHSSLAVSIVITYSGMSFLLTQSKVATPSTFIIISLFLIFLMVLFYIWISSSFTCLLSVFTLINK